MKIQGVEVKVVNVEPCYCFKQYMQGKPITCKCSRCKVQNAGLSQGQLYARMDKAVTCA